MKKIELFVCTDLPKEAERVIKSLLNFEADELVVEPVGSVAHKYSTSEVVNLSKLLATSQNYTEVKIGILTRVKSDTPLIDTTEELCLTRKMMMEGNCKLEEFAMTIPRLEARFFLHQCFGVTLSFVRDPNGRFAYSVNGPTQFYSYKGDTKEVHHFEGRIQTTISMAREYVVFKRHHGDVKPDENYGKTTMLKY